MKNPSPTTGRRRRRLLAPAALITLSALALFVAACGDDNDGGSTAATSADLAGLKQYVTDQTAKLVTASAEMEAATAEYFTIIEAADFDYDAALAENCEGIDAALTSLKDSFSQADPAYELEEGIVAGVPALAQYDVDLDAGSDASDPESAVSFDLELQNGETLKQPGNLFHTILESSLYGTSPDFLAAGFEEGADVNCNGEVEPGEGLPDAYVLDAAVGEFVDQANALEQSIAAWEPTSSDAFTALVVMTPTMEEYFGQWKNSVFVAGEDGASEAAFISSSRLTDIADILTGLQVVWGEIDDQVAAENASQAEQITEAQNDLLAFATDLRDREEGGEQFTPEQADRLGVEAQDKAQAVTGQIAQAAEDLGIEIQE